ncbi:MAG: hypothetical protein K0R98_815 [Rickettsiaceae bacterium]|jgi:hypothetical protein|nr:hypothetical protein [Rickettsiaceae bacterium]
MSKSKKPIDDRIENLKKAISGGTSAPKVDRDIDVPVTKGSVRDLQKLFTPKKSAQQLAYEESLKEIDLSLSALPTREVPLINLENPSEFLQHFEMNSPRRLNFTEDGVPVEEVSIVSSPLPSSFTTLTTSQPPSPVKNEARELKRKNTFFHSSFESFKEKALPKANDHIKNTLDAVAKSTKEAVKQKEEEETKKVAEEFAKISENLAKPGITEIEFDALRAQQVKLAQSQALKAKRKSQEEESEVSHESESVALSNFDEPVRNALARMVSGEHLQDQIEGKRQVSRVIDGAKSDNPARQSTAQVEANTADLVSDLLNDLLSADANAVAAAYPSLEQEIDVIAEYLANTNPELGPVGYDILTDELATLREKQAKQSTLPYSVSLDDILALENEPVRAKEEKVISNPNLAALHDELEQAMKALEAMEEKQKIEREFAFSISARDAKSNLGRTTLPNGEVAISTFPNEFNTIPVEEEETQGDRDADALMADIAPDVNIDNVTDDKHDIDAGFVVDAEYSVSDDIIRSKDAEVEPAIRTELRARVATKQAANKPQTVSSSPSTPEVRKAIAEAKSERSFEDELRSFLEDSSSEEDKAPTPVKPRLPGLDSPAPSLRTINVAIKESREALPAKKAANVTKPVSLVDHNAEFEAFLNQITKEQAAPLAKADQNIQKPADKALVRNVKKDVAVKHTTNIGVEKERIHTATEKPQKAETKHTDRVNKEARLVDPNKENTSFGAKHKKVEEESFVSRHATEKQHKTRKPQHSNVDIDALKNLDNSKDKSLFSSIKNLLSSLVGKKDSSKQKELVRAVEKETKNTNRHFVAKDKSNGTCTTLVLQCHENPDPACNVIYRFNKKTNKIDLECGAKFEGVVTIPPFNGLGAAVIYSDGKKLQVTDPDNRFNSVSIAQEKGQAWTKRIDALSRQNSRSVF